MSPSRTSEGIVITPLEHGADKKCTMGATITGIDLNNLSDEELEAVRAATHKYQLVMIKDQHDLKPLKQWELVTRLDPTAVQVHAHGSIKTFQKEGGMLSKRPVHGLPEAPNVRVIGKGYQGADHYGIKDLTASAPSNSYHRYPPSDESFAAGNTQFQRWHMDAPLYDREPPHFTALRALKLPVGPDVSVNWDDGSGLTLKSAPGQTAFVSNTQLYDLLTPEEQLLAEHSWVEYAPFPYMWMERCKGRTTGLGIESEDLEHSMDEMPEFDAKKIKTYPMVWKTPTGAKALQVHTICVRKIFLRASADAEVKEVTDLREIRKLLYGWQERIVRPEYVLMAPVEEGDVQMWDNWSVFHTAVDYPDHYGSRTMHQVNVGASDSPVGPVPIPVM